MLGIQHFQRQVRRVGEKQEFENVEIEVEDTSTATLRMEGPQGTPYEKGLFRISLTNLQDFPAYPPIVFFQTRIWHPLVEYSTGRVCPAIFKEGWVKEEGLEGFLIRLQAFFSVFKLDTAINFEATSELERNDGSFERHAYELTEKYACD
jgi:ubiquitin-protein ligase